MLVALRDDLGFLTEFFADRVPGTNFNLVLVWNETHQAEAVRAVVIVPLTHWSNTNQLP